MLELPYALNILILVPVCLSLARHDGGANLEVLERKVANSDGLRWLLLSLWTTILLGSVVGLFEPVRMAPLLAVQIVYKSIWLLTFILPLARAEGLAAIPRAITAVFVFIVLVWPFFFVAAWRAGSP